MPACSRCSLSFCLLLLPLCLLPSILPLSNAFHEQNSRLSKLVSALRLGLQLLGSLTLLDCCVLTQLPSRLLSGPLTQHHTPSQLSTCAPSPQKRRQRPGGRTGMPCPKGVCPCSVIGWQQPLSLCPPPSLFSPSSFSNLPRNISYSANENKYS